MTLPNALRVLRALLLLVAVVAPSLAHAQAWWDVDWTKRQQFTLGNAGAAGTLTNLAVMVKLTPTRVTYADFAANGADIRFVSSAGAPLDYEIEEWNPSGDSIVWVEVPSLVTGSSAGSFWMYWGNQGVSDGQSAPNTWRSDMFRAVWHLDGLGNSRGTTTALTAQGGAAPLAAAKIGAGYRFDGTDDYLAGAQDLAQWLGTVDASMEFWINSDDPGTTRDAAGGVTGRTQPGSSDQNEIRWGWVRDNTPDTLNISGGNVDGVGVAAIDATWHHVVYTREASSGKVTLFLDGAQVGGADQSAGGDQNESSSFFDLGRIALDGVADGYLDADLDEVRIYDERVTADWVRASYRAQLDAPTANALVQWCSAGTVWYRDADGDGYGTATNTRTTCFEEIGWVAGSGDCNDGDPEMNPLTLWYVDADDDGRGTSVQAPGNPQCADPSTAQDHYATLTGDCNDGNPRTWDTCAACGDDDSDGKWADCNAYPAGDGPDCNDGNNRTWDTCATCADGDGDTRWDGCNAYPSSTEDCNDANARVWSGAECATCADNDTDGHWSGCQNYPAGDGPDECDGSASNPIDRNNWDIGCTTCGDQDGDGKYSNCQLYDNTTGTITRDYCDTNGNVISENNWTFTACQASGCADDDGDGKYSGCDAYIYPPGTPIIQDFCDVDGQANSEYNWTSTACGGGCADVDTDGRYSGCDSYSADPGLRPPDACDTSAANAVSRNNWVVGDASNPGCSRCADRDGDAAYSECQIYATITQDHCDVDGDPVDENAWTANACALCGDGDGDGKYSQCSAYLTVTKDFCDTNADPLHENNFTQARCPVSAGDGSLGGCNDSDTDKYFENCDVYTFTVAGVFLGRDFCDGAATDPVSINNRTVGACAACVDADSDDYWTACDQYTVTFPGVFEGFDCLDTDPIINPETLWFVDADGDDYGTTTPYGGNPVCADPGAGFTPNDDDCNDGDASFNPETRWFRDGDKDGWGNPVLGVSVLACLDPSDATTEYVLNDDDCDDTNALIETGDWFRDQDGDTWGDPLDVEFGCTQPGGYVSRADDCDDDNASKHLDDGDGISYTDETAAGSDNCSADSDGDGVEDDVEWFPLPGVTPLDLDCDGATPRDTDCDNTPDVVDQDDDNDGYFTEEESKQDLDGADDCTFALDGRPSYVDVDSDGDGVCDGSYVPTGTECQFWTTVDRDPDTGGDQKFQESLGVGQANDNDLDGVPNIYDYDDFDGGACDADGDGLPSSVEVAICYTPPGASSPEKCLDPADRDTDGDGVADGLEVGTNTASPRDTDGDGLPDWWDLDDDADLVLTRHEDYNDLPTSPDPTDDDTDANGVADYLDSDDDGDGVPTADEDGDGDGDPRNDDHDADGIADYLDADDEDGPAGDHDGDGVTNAAEVLGTTDPNDPDTDGDGVLDGLEWADDLGARLDTDGDLVLDVLDLDDDGDGIPTKIEGAWDADGDDDGNHVDTDADGDGLLDRAEGGDAYEADGSLPDGDGDGIPDFLDPTADALDTGGGTGPGPVDDDAGCACGSVPASSGGFGAHALVALALLRRRPTPVAPATR